MLSVHIALSGLARTPPCFPVHRVAKPRYTHARSIAMPPIPLALHFATCCVYIVIVSEFKRQRGRSVAKKR